MKKVLLSMSTFALVAMFASCGSPESAGKKVGEKICECEQIRKDAKNLSDEKEKEEKVIDYKKCEAEKDILSAKAHKKYYDDEETTLRDNPQLLPPGDA